MDDERPSAILQAAIRKAVADALEDAIDWDLTEKLIQPVLTHIDNCSKEKSKCFYFGSGECGTEVSFAIFDESDAVFETGEMPLFSILSTQWLDCARSQADMIYALEHDVLRLKADFEQHFGFPHDEASINADFKQQFPNCEDYRKWQPGDDS